MKEIVLGTKNKDKRREMESLMRGAKVRVRSLADFPPHREAVESGRTFEANARIKARQYSKVVKGLVLADDSGLMVSALNGRPGVYSARFAGPGCTYDDNNRKVLRLLLAKKTRRAKFVSAMALYDSGKFVGCVKGECFGRIAPEARGKNGFGYDPVFIPNGFSKTFGQMPRAVKNRISHRSKALQKAKKLILSYLRKQVRR